MSLLPYSKIASKICQWARVYGTTPDALRHIYSVCASQISIVNMFKFKPFIENLGLRAPIMQAPMAGVSTVEMAAEVAKAGGLGSLPMASYDLTKNTEPVFEQIRRFRHLAGNAPVNVNFFAHDYKEQTPPGPAEQANWFKIMEKASGVSSQDLRRTIPQFERINISFKEFEAKHDVKSFVEQLGKLNVKVVLFHFGLPQPQTVDLIHKEGILVFACVTNLNEAEAALGVGADVLVAQGYEAGGHRGAFISPDKQLSTRALFDDIVDLGMVIPAGGIMDAEDVADYLRKGAVAVSMGTIYVTSEESAAPGFIGDLVKGSLDLPPTVMTALVSGKIARTVKTPFIESLEAQEKVPLPLYGYLYYAYKAAAKQFPPGCGFYLAGTNYGKVTPGDKSATITLRLWQEVQNRIG